MSSLRHLSQAHLPLLPLLLSVPTMLRLPRPVPLLPLLLAMLRLPRPTCRPVTVHGQGVAHLDIKPEVEGAIQLLPISTADKSSVAERAPIPDSSMRKTR